ncbi:MAG: cadherin domain-containing protein [Sulfuricurvum sp.]
MLLDGSGNAIDIMYVNGGYSVNFSCTAPYDTTITNSSSSNKDIYRNPDLNGNWYAGTNSTIGYSNICSSNVYNLTMKKEVDNPTPIVGDTVTFTLSVTNTCKNTASNVTVTDTIPSGFTYQSNSCSGSYNATTRVFSKNFGTLAIGSNQSCDLVTAATVANNYTNTSSLSTTTSGQSTTVDDTDSVDINVSGNREVSMDTDYDTISESDGSGSFTINLNSTYSKNILVDYTISGTASRPGDHDLANGTATILAGETSVDVPFNITDDSLYEGNESIIITLTNPRPANGTLTLSIGTPFMETITILDDDLPVIVDNNNTLNSIPENSFLGTPVGITAYVNNNESGNGIIYSLADNSGGKFTIDSSTGIVTVIGSLDYEIASSHTITVKATGFDDTFALQPFTILISNVNETPVITSPNNGNTYALSVPENTTAVTDVNATDPDAGATLTYSLSGSDASQFTIIPSTGVITFTTAPNYENPTDTNHDNIYTLTVTVSDGFLTDTQDINITLTNVNEPPTTISLSNSSIAENNPTNTLIGTLTTTDTDANNTFSYSILGVGDAASFTISGNQLLTNASFDYETKNSYTLTLRSTDQDGLYVDQNFTISIIDVNEAPIAEYRMDECIWNGLSGEVLDVSANALNGTAYNNATTHTNGKLGNSGDFTDSNDYVNIGHPTLNLSDKITVMGWVNWAIDPSSGASWSNLVSYNSTTVSDESPFILQHNQANTKYEFAIETSGGRQYVQSTTVPLQNTWQHVAGVYDGSYIHLYINGIEESNTTLSGTLINPSNALLQFGQWAYSTNSRNFNGYLDEIKIYDQALTPGQIQTIYTNENNGNNYDGAPRTTPCCCLPYGGNLIANPSFEILCGSNIIQSWNNINGGTVNMRSNICGWSMNGNGMETWENTTTSPASDGNVFVEIDGYDTVVDSLSQTISTSPGIHYIVNFDYRKRDNVHSDVIIAKWNGIEMANVEGVTSGWQTKQIEVIGTGIDVLSFEEPSSANDSYGSWIDNIRISEGTLYAPIYKFDAWDKFRSITDRNISTKIVAKPFELTIASLNDTNNGLQDFNGTICAQLIDTASGVQLDRVCNLWNTKQSLNSTFISSKASKNALVRIAWKKNDSTGTFSIGNEDNSTIASDALAIRPISFNFTDTMATSGTDFNLSFHASGFDGNDTLGYNETTGGTFDVTIAEKKPACPLGIFSTSITPFSFLNGFKTVTGRYNDVGVLDINVSDLSKSCQDRYAAIDCDDANVSDGINFTADLIPIGLKQGTLTVKPHHFDLNATLSNFKGETYTYLSNDLNMSAQLDLNITAKGANNIKTPNYNSACYAQNTNYTFPYTTSPSVTASLSFITNTADTYTPAYSSSSFGINAMNKTLFSTDHNGSANFTANLNFQRSVSSPINPFDMDITSATITDAIDSSVTGTDDTVGNATFVYGRVHPYDITTNIATTPNPVEIEIYSTSSGGFVAGMPQNVLHWYRNTAHDDNSTGQVYAGSGTSLTIDTSASPLNGQDPIQITYNSTAAYTTGVKLDIPEWLWYSPSGKAYDYVSADCKAHPCFLYRYIPIPAGSSDTLSNTGGTSAGVESGTFDGADFTIPKSQNTSSRGVKLFR